VSSRISSLAICLPDRHATRIWLAAIVTSAAIWAFLISAAGESHLQHLTSSYWSVLAAGCALLGIAYGSLFTSILLLIRVALRKIDSRVIPVSALIFFVHIASVGLLSLLGVWNQPWPWQLGLIPFLWK
jgi:hypothetical protein